jgi:SAM-dependent methyltransferase
MCEQTFRLKAYPEASFGGFSEADGTVHFYTRVHALLHPDSVVLDVGCGRGAYGEDEIAFRREVRILRGKCRQVIGIDVDPAGRQNPFVDDFRLIEGTRWPLDDGSVDLCLSDYVLELVPDPELFFAECARVLKPGGVFCARTPNRYGYVAMVASCVPNKLHATVLKKIGKKLGGKDTFPTVYRCNTSGRIKRLMRQYGFEGCVRGIEDEPTYLVFSKLAYRMGAVVHRMIPPGLKGNLLILARKAA